MPDPIPTPPPTPDGGLILSLRGICKNFGAVSALTDIDLDVHAGEVVALVGDNGAGKSTMIKALAGALRPDAGEIRLDGQPVSFRTPMEARNAGIESVFQNLALSPALSIADNLFLGREIRTRGIGGHIFHNLDRRAMAAEARRQLTALGLTTVQDIHQKVETLSGGQRQGIAVARACAFGGRVVIMDEPTAALGVKESRRVLDMIEGVRSRGLAVILISHNMPHVFEVADRIHIHRLSRRLAVVRPGDCTMSDVVAFMTGAAVPPPDLSAA